MGALARNSAKHESTYQAKEALFDVDQATDCLVNAVKWMETYEQGVRRPPALPLVARQPRSWRSTTCGARATAWLPAREEAIAPRSRPGFPAQPAPKSASATVRRVERTVADAEEWIAFAVAEWNALAQREFEFAGFRPVRDPDAVERDRNKLEGLIERVTEVVERNDLRHDIREDLRQKLKSAVRDWDVSF